MTSGRKRAFDKAAALDAAMHVFWSNGYAGTSISDLTGALGINKPSLYAAFGNKEQLFEAALEHYTSQYGAPMMRRLTTPADAPLRERLRSYLLGVSELTTGKRSPRGCLFVKSSCEAGGDAFPEEASAALRDIGVASEQALADLLREEQAHGRLAGNADPKALADYLLSVVYGLSVLARRGKSRDELGVVVDLAVETMLGGRDSASPTGRGSDAPR